MPKLATLTTIAIGIVALIVVMGQAPAQAVSLEKVKCSGKNRMSCGKVNLHKGKTTYRFLRNHPEAGTAKSRKSVLKSALYLIRYGKYQIRMAQPVLPAHYAGWNCIHSREGAWNSNTGNGYYGGLQAHYGWGGVARMDLLSAMQQMWVAERELAETGYSHAWLAGQWPNTYPPCSSYF